MRRTSTPETNQGRRRDFLSGLHTLILGLLLSLPLGAQVTTYPFNANFTIDMDGFATVNGNATNQWHRGSATGNAAPSLYVSNNGGGSNAFTNWGLSSAASTVFAYQDFTFPADASNITVNFNWKGQGGNNNNRMRVWLVPTSFTLVPGVNGNNRITATGSAPTGRVQLGGDYGGTNSWQTADHVLPASYAGTTVRLVFEWNNRNNFLGATQPPAAIDNISVTMTLPACTGTPAPGNTVASLPTACPNENIALSLQNTTAGSGVSYQWQWSPNGADPWTDFGTSNATQNVTQPSARYYRCIVTCTATNQQGISAQVLVGDPGLADCYCTAEATDLVDEWISNVNFAGIDHPSGSTGYSNFTSISGTVQVGVSYPFSATLGINGPYDEYVRVYIDWNQDGVFQANEHYNIGTCNTFGCTVTNNIAVPVGATLGTTLMRVVMRYDQYHPAGGCGIYQYGEVEDYALNVLPAPSCAQITNVVVGNVTGGSAQVSFSNILGDVYLEWGAPGFIPGTEENLGGGISIAGPFNTSPVVISGLSPLTAYNVQVRQECTPADWSANAGANFSTPIGCGGPFYDSGGPGGNYGADEDITWTICPDTPGEQVIVLFNSFNVSAFFDALYVFNGPTIGSPQISSGNGGGLVPGGQAGGFWGTDAPGPFMSTHPSGCITFRFRSWFLGNAPGWSADIICMPPATNVNCATADLISCNQLRTGNTLGLGNSLPTGACAFPGAASTAGTNWWQFNATADEDITVTTCGLAWMNTRISVFTGTGCGDLTCIALNEDYPGCSNNSSEVTFPAQNGQSYWIAVHGVGGASGPFQMALSCSPLCAPASGNDLCSAALPVIPVLNDGFGTAIIGDNSCAYSEQHTSCSGTLPVQGVWYGFNTGPSTLATLELWDNDLDQAYTANDLSFALFDGNCTGLSATGELVCETNGGGSHALPVQPGTDYLLLVYNTGGVGVEGTFGLMITTPPQHDAMVLAINSPVGLYCGSQIAPEVTLRNNGEQPLTSVEIIYQVDEGSPVTTLWTGNLPYQQTTQVTLNASTVSAGFHTLDVYTNNPNGQVDEIPGNDSFIDTFDSGGEVMQLVIRTDDYGADITWEVLDVFSLTAASGGPYGSNQTITEDLCLDALFGNCFYLTLYDGFGDGMCCDDGNGWWEVRNGSGDLLLRDLFEDGIDGFQSPPSSGHLTPFYASNPGHSICLPGGPASIMDTECNVFTNTLSNRVYCQPVPGAAQYQFEFLDPDKGYLRRIARPTNNVLLGEIVTFPLIPGTVYFVRSRADLGFPGYFDDDFGAGCEMGIDADLVPGCTSLIDDPALNSYSCGVFRSFGGSDRIWAWPVLGGQQYRFRFANIGEGYVRNIVRNNYVCVLNWYTMPLQDGVTYDVTVEVMVNNTWSGFCGPACTVTVQNPPANGSIHQRDLEMAVPEVTLWPNPVSGAGQVYLMIDRLSGEEQRITVDIHDMSGKRVLSREYGNVGTAFTGTLDLEHLASGMYTVIMNTGGTVHSEKLLVQ